MSNNNQQNNLPLDVVQEIIKTEQLRVQQQTEEIKTKQVEIESNERVARVTIEYQFKLMQDAQAQKRKSALVNYSFIILGLLILFAFLGYLVFSNHTEFAKEILEKIAYVIVTIAGFFAGRLSKKSNSSDKSSSDTEIIN